MGPRCTRIGGSCRSVSCRTLVLFEPHAPASPPHPWIPPAAWRGGEVTMRTYDPADAILYVHLAQEPATPVTSPKHAGTTCHRLAAGYANRNLETRLGEPLRADGDPVTGDPRSAGGRPALFVIPGGAESVAGSAHRGATTKQWSA